MSTTQAVVEMGECKDCHQPWSMSQQEHDGWQLKVATGDCQMPKRCPACRRLRRVAKGREAITTLATRLHELAVAVLNGEYDGMARDGLAQELEECSAKVVELGEWK